MLFVLGSGFSAATGQTVIDTVERILSINEHAGEKGIPAKVREAALEFLEQEPPITFDTMSIPEIDAHIDELRSGASARAKVG